MAALIVRAMAWGGETPSNPFTDKCDPTNPQNCVDDELEEVGKVEFHGQTVSMPFLWLSATTTVARSHKKLDSDRE